MTFPQPTDDAIARIHSLGEKGLCEFFDEVSLGSMQNLAPYLPSVPGFRNTSQAGIAQQKRVLARRIISGPKQKSTAQNREYRALYQIWRIWAMERLGNSAAIDDLLDKVEEIKSEPHPKEPEDKFVDNEAVTKLFASLKQWSHDNKCSREQIERLFAFSPFARTPDIAELIAESKSAADVDRDAVYSEIPQRLQQDEQEIQSLTLISQTPSVDGAV